MKSVWKCGAVAVLLAAGAAGFAPKAQAQYYDAQYYGCAPGYYFAPGYGCVPNAPAYNYYYGPPATYAAPPVFDFGFAFGGGGWHGGHGGGGHGGGGGWHHH